MLFCIEQSFKICYNQDILVTTLIYSYYNIKNVIYNSDSLISKGKTYKMAQKYIAMRQNSQKIIEIAFNL